MLFGTSLLLLAGASSALPKLASKYAAADLDAETEKAEDARSPKAVIININQEELELFHKNSPVPFDKTIVVPGLSPLDPYVYCTEDYSVCNVAVGASEVNAAVSVSALLASPKFNFTQSYFLVAGTGEIDPAFGGLGSVAVSRYTVSVGLQNEVDAREIPGNWTNGFWSEGADAPGTVPNVWTGTEVFEVNGMLRDHVVALANTSITLNTTASTNLTDSLYANATVANSSVVFNGSINATANASAQYIANITGPTYLTNVSAAVAGPVILECDSTTSDVIYNGNLLSSVASNITSVFTNGTGQFCITAREDSAILEAALRNAQFGLTDYNRWVLMRAGNKFDRPPVSSANETVAFANSNTTESNELALVNLYLAAEPFILDILANWDSYEDATFVSNTTGVKNGTYAPTNYVGDIYGSLGGEPDFGPGIKYNVTDFASSA